jgi:hypothetical protein
MLHTMKIKLNSPAAEKAIQQMKENGSIEILDDNHIPDEIQQEALKQLHLMKTQPGYEISEEDLFSILKEDDHDQTF